VRFGPLHEADVRLESCDRRGLPAVVGIDGDLGADGSDEVGEAVSDWSGLCPDVVAGREAEGDGDGKVRACEDLLAGDHDACLDLIARVAELHRGRGDGRASDARDTGNAG
jgi:hypothetical protein